LRGLELGPVTRDHLGRVVGSEIATVAAHQHGVVSRSQAEETGIDGRAIVRRVDNGEWLRLDTEVFTVNGAPRTRYQSLWAAYLSRPEALVTGRSAASIYNFPGVEFGKPQILLPFTGNARSPIGQMIRSRHYELIAHQPVDGLRVTTRAETLLVLAFRSPPTLVERWVDSQMAVDKLAAADFDPIFARLANARLRGLRPLQRIVIARDRDAYQPPTSHLEHHLYRVLDHPDIPPSVRQLPFAFDAVDATVDAYIEDWRMIVEADGRRWHTKKADFESDRRRDNAAAERGLLVMRFTYRMLKDDPDGCVRTLVHAGRWR
jgi:hypothetical protein